MSRSDRIVACSLIGALSGLTFAGCTESATPSPARNHDRTPIVQDEAPPLPDFRHYVIGSLAQPDAGTRDPFRERDGFVPPTQRSLSTARSKTTPVRFLLRGIVERDGHRVALFRRGSVRVGESLAGWKVREINARAVTLERSGKKQRLSL